MTSAAVKRAAQATARAALAAGRISVTGGCRSCGADPDKGAWFHGGPLPRDTKLHLHHPDYSQPEWVIPLCMSCHKLVHIGQIREPETGRFYPRPRRSLTDEQRAARGLPPWPRFDTRAAFDDHQRETWRLARERKAAAAKKIRGRAGARVAAAVRLLQTEHDIIVVADVRDACGCSHEAAAEALHRGVNAGVLVALPPAGRRLCFALPTYHAAPSEAA